MATGVSRAEHVSVTYRIEPGADGIRLVRTGERARFVKLVQDAQRRAGL